MSRPSSPRPVFGVVEDKNRLSLRNRSGRRSGSECSSLAIQETRVCNLDHIAVSQQTLGNRDSVYTGFPGACHMAQDGPVWLNCNFGMVQLSIWNPDKYSPFFVRTDDGF